ncbi:hypothetical protein ACFL1A_03200, partial [Patescibacteria group bacterium]
MKKRKLYFAILLFICLAGVLFWEFLTEGKPPFPGNYMQAWYEPWRSINFINGKIMLAHKPVAEDVFRHLLPFRLLAVESFKKFQLPLWNPYNGSGMPLLATVNSGFLDPFNFIYFFLPANIAYGSYIFLQFVLISTAFYLYAKSICLSQKAALLASLILVFSGFVIIRLIFTIYGSAIASFLLMLFIIEKLRKNEKSKLIYTLPFLVFIMIVSSQTQIVIYFLSITFLYATTRLRAGMKSFLSKNLRLFMIMLILGVFLSSIQTLPTYELMKLSHINPGDSQEIINKFLVPAKHLISIAIPNFFGNSSTYNFWGYGDYVQTIAYVGLLPIFLALLSFKKKQKTDKSILWFFITLAIISIFLAFDWIGSRLFYSLPIPILSTGAPARIFILTTVSISVLAGIGFDNILSQKKFPWKALAVAGLLILFVISLLGTTYYLDKSEIECRWGVLSTCFQVGFRNTLLASTVFVVQFIILTALYITGTKKKLQKVLLFLFFASFIIPQIYNASKFLPHTPTTELFPRLEVVKALQEKTIDARVFGIGEATLETNLATQFRIFDPQFYHPLYILRYRELVEYANNGKHNTSLPRGSAAIKNYYSVSEDLIYRRDRLLNLDSVKYRLYKKPEVTSSPSGNLVWESPDWLLIASRSALPKAYLTQKIVIYFLSITFLYATTRL